MPNFENANKQFLAPLFEVAEMLGFKQLVAVGMRHSSLIVHVPVLDV